MTKRLLPLFLFLVPIFANNATAATAQRIDVGHIVVHTVSLNSGQTYTFETALDFGDPSLAIIPQGSHSQVARNDNNGDIVSCTYFPTTICQYDKNARITFTPSSSGLYDIWMYSNAQASGGSSDLLQDGSLLLDSVTFGGELVELDTYNTGDWIRATAQGREAGCEDTITLLDQPADPSCTFFCLSGFLQGDDDSGYNLSSAFTANWGYRSNTNGKTHLLVGLGDSANCSTPTSSVLITVDEPTFDASNDPDDDGLTTSLEALLGTDPQSSDTDEDGIDDTFEVHGNNGFSYATGGYHLSYGVTPATTRNIFLDLLFMQPSGAPDAYEIPAGVISRLEDNFLNETDDGVILEVVSEIGVPFHAAASIAASGCTQVSDCKTIDQLKSSHVPDYSSKYNWFRFGLAAGTVYIYDANTNAGEETTAVGWGEYGGHNFIMDMTNLMNLSGSTTFEERYEGLIVHELGHTVWLDHNFNDDYFGAPWSSLHKSVMNYRYTFPGIDNTRVYEYSSGTFDTYGNPVCNNCETSTKGWCQSLDADNLCTYGALGDDCDCDFDEWGILRADTYDGELYAGGSSAHRKDPRNSRQLVGQDPSSYAPRSLTARQKSAAKLKHRLEDRHMIEGTHFFMTPARDKILMH